MKQLSPEMEERVRLSVDLFTQGFGCCQSVIAAFADMYGMDRDTALRIGAGFGGGIGRPEGMLLIGKQKVFIGMQTSP